MSIEEKATLEATIILLHNLARLHNDSDYRKMGDAVASLLKKERERL